ncbi:hypothetical protein BABINDRAFT_162385 [Babjeviella inositovora NRRL Y-12698]|uniref:Uncharacterized protein n=1 Tax=Babjeviella inositovora NRRL Y-12698 TaxID=984486 RepID=A0A1E3QLW4_9ASCO|nr:uncharacterized protein BABINDRAFT_162385 [Babjeviella inositovora NRRL Y-12698]ODQ78683.1 hypothetical protein BABINDRAFT_162385 [Babjeviella inositovora NRRL Y-12698]
MALSQTARRFWLALFGGSVGIYIGLLPLRKYEIIKREPVPLNEDGTKKRMPFNVKFREAQPLQLKPEYEAEYQKAKAAAMEKEKEVQAKLEKEAQARLE